jgi:hypothetical protein
VITDVNSEDGLVQATFAKHLERALGWESVNAWHHETFGPNGTLDRALDPRGGPGARPARGARPSEPLFDDSRAGGTRKIVARNHQVLGVNRAVASVQLQENLKRRFLPRSACSRIFSVAFADRVDRVFPARS